MNSRRSASEKARESLEDVDGEELVFLFHDSHSVVAVKFLQYHLDDVSDQLMRQSMGDFQREVHHFTSMVKPLWTRFRCNNSRWNV